MDCWDSIDFLEPGIKIYREILRTSDGLIIVWKESLGCQLGLIELVS
jgi:hypothetical protein